MFSRALIDIHKRHMAIATRHTAKYAAQQAALRAKNPEHNLSINDKMRDVKIDEESGIVTHKHILNGDGTYRTFPSKAIYQKWYTSQRQKMLSHYKNTLTPLQYHVTQQKGTERAFTGAYWETKDVGKYSCVVCSNNLFLFEHKYNNTSGYPTFWNALKNSVKFVDDHLEVPEPTQCVIDPELHYKEPIKRCQCAHVSPSFRSLS